MARKLSDETIAKAIGKAPDTVRRWRRNDEPIYDIVRTGVLIKVNNYHPDLMTQLASMQEKINRYEGLLKRIIKDHK